MAIIQGICRTFKLEAGSGTHNFTSGGDTFKCALYTAGTSLDPEVVVQYFPEGESSGAGYTAGGINLVSSIVLDQNVAVVDFEDVEWTGASFEASGALVYNSSKSNKAVCIIDFGQSYQLAGTTLRIVWPIPNLNSAIIQLH